MPPDRGGVRIYEAVRDRWPALLTHFGFMSGDTVSEESRRLLDELGLPSLAKPFLVRDLLQTVAALVA